MAVCGWESVYRYAAFLITYHFAKHISVHNKHALIQAYHFNHGVIQRGDKELQCSQKC